MTVVVLDEDVAQVFTTPESSKVLRALIEAMPQAASDETANSSVQRTNDLSN